MIVFNGSEFFDFYVGLGYQELFMFYWLCRRVGEEFLFEYLFEIKVVFRFLNFFKLLCGGCFGIGVGRLDFNELLFVLNVLVLESLNVIYVFKFIVIKDVRFVSDEKLVEVVKGNFFEVLLKLVCYYCIIIIQLVEFRSEF